MKSKTCKICGNEFIPTNNRQLTCSDECSTINKRNLNNKSHLKNYRPRKSEPKNCAFCGKEFIPEHGCTKTCSEECKREWNKKQPSRAKQRVGGRVEPLKPINCAYCGIEFTPKQYDQRCCCDDHGRRLWNQHYEQPKKYAYICKYCGKDYLTTHKDRNQFCSKDHAYAFRAKAAEEKRKLRIAGRTIVCLSCGKEFIRKREDNKFCSIECSRKFILGELLEKRKANHTKRTYICKECGSRFIPSFGNKHRSYCSDECRKKRFSRISKAARRARIHGVEHEAIDPLAICKRDKWRCQLCGIKTPKSLRGTIMDNAPEMDHIIPLALGGSHTWANVQCLCRKCNQTKGATIAGQLRLM